MDLVLRPAAPDDAEICGQICFDAFGAIAQKHGFPSDWPNPAAAAGFISGFLGHPQFYGVIAELDGQVVGSNFLDERASVSGLGPITVDPEVQDSSIGRRLMEHALDRAAAAGAPGVRLVQVAYHNRSLCLYAKLGFEAREMLSCLQGPPPAVEIPGYEVRPAKDEDVEACNELCRSVHGFHRGAELADGIRMGTASVVEHGGEIKAFASAIGFGGYAVAESNEGLKALLGSAPEIGGPGVLVPTSNGETVSLVPRGWVEERAADDADELRHVPATGWRSHSVHSSLKLGLLRGGKGASRITLALDPLF